MAEIDVDDDLIFEQLPQRYRESRDIGQVRSAWRSLLVRCMGRHLEEIRMAIQNFSSAQSKFLGIVARYERDETAQRIIHEFAEDSIPGLIQLLSDTSLQGTVTKDPIMCDGDLDARSFTMGPDATTSLDLQARTSVGPPAASRTVAPVAPMTPASTRSDERVSVAGPSGLRTLPTSLDVGIPTQRQKRPLEEAGQLPRGADSPLKKARGETSFQKSSTFKVWRTIQLWEIDGDDYIFQEPRCGPGWFIVRCNLSKQVGVNEPVGFDRHPLEENVAMDHFNNKNLSCHDSTTIYTLESIMQDFGHRGK